MAVVLWGAAAACDSDLPGLKDAFGPTAQTPRPPARIHASIRSRSIHVFVALCDNLNQGIVPVPAALGRGNDPANNLYWGAAYGVRTWFRRSRKWKLVAEFKNPSPEVMQRIVFKRVGRSTYLIADAYRGTRIRAATLDFLNAAAGRGESTLKVGGKRIHLGGAAGLAVYVGHNGLMDFKPAAGEPPTSAFAGRRDAIILACQSKSYFTSYLRRAGARPLLLTTGNMAPEAYTLAAAIEGWLRGESVRSVRIRAARAYHKYQKCGMRGARRLFDAN